jgi:GT2 family glycosyltransferase
VIRLPAAENPEVSLIVLLDGAAEMGERCLRAVAAGDDSVPCETVILLNDPDSALEDLVRKATTGAQVVVSRANAGPGVGWNLGAEVARAPRLATLHEDSEPNAGWLAPLCEAMSEYGAGAVGSRLYNHDGTVQDCGWVLYSDASHWPIDESVAPEVVAASEPTPADILAGAAMLLDRDAVRAAGGWDERFHPAVFGDIDISTAMWSQGRRVLSVPASGVRHQSGAFDRRENTPLTGPRLRGFLIERHRGRFVAKWGPVLRDLAPPPAYTDPQSTRASVQAALARTRERAEQIRSGSWTPSGRAQSAKRHFSGIPAPVLDKDEGVYAVAPEVEVALNAGESELVADYCRMLARKEQETSAQLVEVHELHNRSREEIADLHRRHQELATTLNDILQGKTWRLRNLVHKTLNRARAAIARATGMRRRRSG